MPVVASAGEKREFFLVPAGTHRAVCYGVWDIGLQKTVFQGQEKTQHKCVVGFEIDEQIPSGEYTGKRMTIFKRYTLSLSEKATLRKDLESWRGRAFTPEELRGFDIEKLVGVSCMLSVVHNVTRDASGDRTYANIVSVSKLMKGVESMKPENPSTTPEWIKKLQEKAVNPVVHEEEPPPPTDDDSEVPF